MGSREDSDISHRPTLSRDLGQGRCHVICTKFTSLHVLGVAAFDCRSWPLHRCSRRSPVPGHCCRARGPRRTPFQTARCMPVRQGSWPRVRHSLVRCCAAVRDHRLAAQPRTPIAFDDLGLLVVRQVLAHSCDFFELGLRLANMSSLFGRSVANISASPAVPRPAFSPPTAVLRCIISKV